MKIRFVFKGILRKQTDVRILQFYITNKTTSTQLFVPKWPEPILPRDNNYLEAYNNQIWILAQTLMKLKIKHLNEGIQALEANKENCKKKVFK